AEDGIRDGHVTGVQTCALPIFPPSFATTFGQVASSLMDLRHSAYTSFSLPAYGPMPSGPPKWLRMIVVPGYARASPVTSGIWRRSEERRVGKECMFRW